MVWIPEDGLEKAPLLPPELWARVRQIEIRTHRLVNTALSGGYRSTFRGSGLEFQEVRAYQPGDDVRAIDWNVTARMGEPFIKHYVEERELTLELLVDTSRSMDFGSRLRTKRETAAQFCALIAFVAMHHGDRVGLSLFGERPGLHLAARKDNHHVLRVVREVIAAPPSDGATRMDAVLEDLSRTLKRRSIVFVVSDFLALDEAPAVGEYGARLVPGRFGGASASASQAAGPPNRPGTSLAPYSDPAWVDALSRLARRHDVIAVRVGDPFEDELPEAGLIELVEVESGRRRELDTRSRAVRDAWAAAARERRATLRERLARARADKIELDTTGDLGEAVLSFFRRRTKRHAGRPA